MYKFITKKYLSKKRSMLHKEYLKAYKEKDLRKVRELDEDITALLHVLNEVL